MQNKISNGMKIKTAIISILFVPFFVFAQAGLPAEGLPNAGLTPESPFYFFDKLGEAIREFFTFNPEGKARLQVAFAAERISEIKVILETKGVEAKGLDVAQSRLQANIAKAATIVERQKAKGKDVSTLVKELDDELETSKSALADSFKSEKRVLKAKEDELKTQLKVAHRAGDTVKEESLAQELGQVKAQKELLELKEEDIEDDLEAEEEKLEEEMEARHKAEEAIREAEKEKQEIIDEAAEESAELPANAFAEFDRLFQEAKRNFEEGDFVKARQFAKHANKSLDQIEKTIDELEKKQEKKEEAEEAIQEAKEEKQEVLNEASKEGVELPAAAFTKFDRLLAQAQELFAKENYQGAKQLAEQAEDALDNVDKEIEKLEKAKEQKEEQVKNEEERKREQEEKEREKAEEEVEQKNEQFKKEERRTENEQKQIEDQLNNSNSQPSTSQTPSAKENVVNYTNSGYSPNALTVKKGEIVTFKNQSSQSMWTASAVHPTHRVYPTTGGCFGSTFDACAGIQSGNSWPFKFDIAGAWKYHNHLIPGDTGTIVVE